MAHHRAPPQVKIACVVIAHEKRPFPIREQCVRSALSQGFDDVVVVGDYGHGDGYRYLHVPQMTGTTIDALIKRDVGTLATDADVIVYLSDDHALAPDFCSSIRHIDPKFAWDVIVPYRRTQHPTKGKILIPNGGEDGYCAGHAGVFKREVVTRLPWTAQLHHRNWDLIASRDQMADGATFVQIPSIEIEDLQPETKPWQ